jgi:hypothetical protein
MLGISDGQSTEIVRGEVKEGQDVITGIIGATQGRTGSGTTPQPGPRLRL